MTHQEPPRGRRIPGIALRHRWISSVMVAVAQLIGTNGAARNQSGRVHLDALAYVLLLAGPALLPLRHRLPVLVAAGTTTVAAVYLALGYPYGPVFLSVIVAFFTAIGAGHRRAVLIIAGTVYTVEQLLVGHWLYRWLPPAGDGPTSWMTTSGIAAWLLAVLAGAELFRSRSERVARERRERAEAESRRAGEERLRIARELHDVLAHSISVINVQAGVALALMDEHPEQARTALTTIKAASKEALGEVRQVLSTLRAPGDAPRSPAPGLDRLPELAEQAAGAGLKVDLSTVGARFPLPPGADLAAFRIIQEALTNIVRHSASRTARVRLGYGPEGVELSVDDDGPSSPRAEPAVSGGNGLVGMRERAAALGGTVEAGPRPDGGFRVLAKLPTGAAGTVAVATEEEGR
ncbi:sensor histidine kinase [Streptomyces sp. NPDC006733]|uniref:sensor histidine kinase n=1 Tax=Streptomyces sp. NPDC006733 TaxID=3155460 RepID=UPI0033F41D56